MKIVSLLAILLLAPFVSADNLLLMAFDNSLVKPELKTTVTRATYAIMSARAATEGKPLVLFVGVPVRSVPGAVSHSWWEAEDQSPRILVCRPKHGQPLTAQVLPTNATDAQILERGNQLTPRPFLRKLRLRSASLLDDQREAVDDDGVAAGPWPIDVPFNDGLVLYKPAEWTQRSFDRELTGIRGNALIEAIHRSAMPSKWSFPGGMEGISGWRSDLYKSSDNLATNWRGPTAVNEFYPPVTFQRSYDDGAEFHDVLSNANTGLVFEHRIARKRNGEWERLVAYRDKKQYPAGYSGLKVQCISCHAEAGTGAYGQGYVPGGDTILSDAIPALER